MTVSIRRGGLTPNVEASIRTAIRSPFRASIQGVHPDQPEADIKDINASRAFHGHAQSPRQRRALG